MSSDPVLLLAQRLQAWYSQNWDAPSQAVHFIYSPEWDAALKDAWPEYEQIVQALQKELRLGVPKFHWQQTMEDMYYDRTDEAKTHRPENHRKPLWVHLRYYRHQEVSGHCRAFGWQAAANDWGDFRQIYHSDKSFASSLSTNQHAAYAILEDWWTAAFCDVSLPVAARAFLDRVSGAVTSYDPMDVLKRFAQETKIKESLYQSLCFRLWLFEFHPRTWEPYKMVRSTPDEVLHLAHLHSLPMKMAHAVLHPVSALDQHALHPPYYDRVLGEVAEDFYHNLELAATSRPYYLWDTKRRKTVEVSSFAECPPYTCISHTWGRWRTRQDEHVPGVPWKVPANTLYKVKDLPVMLSRLGDPYVWFDLVCIPQDKGERSQLEISKQSSIFRRCQRCVAWLHDVPSWDGVLKALDWLCLEFLRGTWKYPPDLVTEKHARATAERNEACELMIFDHEKQQANLTSWFTSLWTLQEAAMCPDIQLYSKDWQRLDDRRGVAISARVLIEVVCQTTFYFRKSPLDCPDFSQSIQFDAICGEMPLRHKERTPSGVMTLISFQKQTNLRVVLSQGSPIAVLLNGQLRKCTSNNRAPAIMSALGITKWFEERVNTPDARETQDEMVFNMYPLRFLREAAAKFRGIFFDVVQPAMPRQTAGHDKYSSLAEFHRGQVQGTLLPFSADPSGLLVSLNNNIRTGSSHPSLSDWSIESDASVSMSSAGILLTSQDSPYQPAVRALFAHSVSVNGVYAEYVQEYAEDLRKSLTEWQRGNSCLYAVALMSLSDEGMLVGVILEELPQPWSQTTYLRKIGYFRHVQHDMPPKVAVDWRVL